MNYQPVVKAVVTAFLAAVGFGIAKPLILQTNPTFRIDVNASEIAQLENKLRAARMGIIL